MTDSKPAAQAGAAPSGGPGRDDEHWLTGLLRSDAVIMMLAHAAAGGGELDGALAARRHLDAEVRALATWPTGEDYARAAADCDRVGRAGDAELLYRAAEAGPLIAAAEAAWNRRYARRPPGPAAELIAALYQDPDAASFDPAGPYPGTDGAAYHPGVLHLGTTDSPVLAVAGRGGAELIAGWPGYTAMTAWTATRGTTATGPLTPPPMRRDARTWQEDQVLAGLLAQPRDTLLHALLIPPGTFTTDVRYDTYAAVRTLNERGQRVTPEAVTAEVARRMTAVPAHAAGRYGGPAAPFARAYIARLAATPATPGDAMTAARCLIGEDRHYQDLAARTRPAARPAPSGHAPGAAALAPAQDSAAPPGPPLRRPALPSPAAAPEPGR